MDEKEEMFSRAVLPSVIGTNPRKVTLSSVSKKKNKKNIGVSGGDRPGLTSLAPNRILRPFIWGVVRYC